MADGVQCLVDQVGTVQERMYLYSLGQDSAVQFIYSLMHFLQGIRRILTTQHLHDALYGIIVCAFIINVTQYTLPLQIAVFQLTKVLQIYRDAIGALYHNISDCVKVAHQANASDHIAQATLGKQTTASIDIVLLNFLHHIIERYTIFCKLVWRQLNLILSGYTSKVTDIGNTLNLPKVRNNRPFVYIG